VFGGLGDTAFTNFNPLTGRQDRVYQADLCDLIEHLPRLVSQPRPDRSGLRQRLPEDIRQEANQKMGLHPMLSSCFARFFGIVGQGAFGGDVVAADSESEVII